jgi:hypothetical protein
VPGQHCGRSGAAVDSALDLEGARWGGWELDQGVLALRK